MRWSCFFWCAYLRPRSAPWKARPLDASAGALARRKVSTTYAKAGVLASRGGRHQQAERQDSASRSRGRQRAERQNAIQQEHARQDEQQHAAAAAAAAPRQRTDRSHRADGYLFTKSQRLKNLETVTLSLIGRVAFFEERFESEGLRASPAAGATGAAAASSMGAAGEATAGNAAAACGTAARPQVDARQTLALYSRMLEVTGSQTVCSPSE